MEKWEFLQLKIDTVVSTRPFGGKESNQEYYVIYDTDQFGSEYRGKEFCVYGANQLDGDGCIRISSTNYQFFNVEGEINRE
ncbi:MAG: hypothetical protein PHY47_18045 [Lachnospiraceae bacterium]|nr:hypothetical protein [Lachnospiraceae bacterium]